MATDVRRSPIALTVLALLEIQPLHPYAVQRLIRAWAKDEVINVGQRATLYKVFGRLEQAGLIEIRERSRDQRYPDRTIYAVTENGRRVAHRWLADILTTPRNEFPEFPAALSFAAMVQPQRLAELLAIRRQRLTEQRDRLKAGLGSSEAKTLPRVALIENEYLLAMVEAELTWVTTTVHQLQDGAFAWVRQELIDAARGSDQLPEGD